MGQSDREVPMSRVRAVLLFALILTASAGQRASAAGGGTIGGHLADLFRDIPADRIPSGILYDRVVPLAAIDGQTGAEGSGPVTRMDWLQIYGEMYRASLAAPTWPEPLTLARRTARTGRNGVIPIAVMNLFYDRVRPDAFKTGALLARDGRVALGTGDPFVAGRVFSAAPLRDHTYAGESAVFELDAAEYFTNDPVPVRSVEADFDDGRGFVPVRIGARLQVRYAIPGTKSLRIRFSMADGTALHSESRFDVRALATPLPDDTLHVTATIPYQSAYGAGDAYVYLSDQHTTLTEPVLVIEGFDLDNSMNWEELYALLNREQLLEQLRSDGFDAVVLNFNDATDYVQRNAFVAVETIEQIQQAIPPGRTIAVTGASMGGLIGRYALSYMEANGLPHAARTFISFDSPQAGAAIPLGIQYWLWFFADQSTEAAAELAALDSPAARQLLVYHHTDPPGTTGQADPLRANLEAELTAIGGYPSLPRKVAMANGSGSRTGQGFAPGAQIIRWEYSSLFVSITGNCWAVPDQTNQSVFHGLLRILFSTDQISVTVSGTRPYDNAPGGWRDSMAQLDASIAPYGDIVALYPDHCFIPTVSSLALDTTDLFYDVAGDPDILSHTPFDAVYFPMANQEHVDINAENAQWLLSEIEQGVSGVGGRGSTATGFAAVESTSPNPVGASTRIRFVVPRPGHAVLAVHDAAGRRVGIIEDRDFDSGGQEVVWGGEGFAGARLSPGIYFVSLRGDGFEASRKVTLR
jgi:hypothetical protein